MDSNLSCPVCYDSYDPSERVPRVIPICGHTLCSRCITEIRTKSTEFKCPLDKKIYSSYDGPLKLENFPVNYALVQMIGKDKKACPLHGEEFRFVCLTDRTKLCDTCMCETDKHLGHKFIPIKQIYVKADSAKNEIQEILRNIDHHADEVSKTLEEEQAKQIKVVHEHFDQIKRLVHQKELDICFEVYYFFDDEKKRVSEVVEGVGGLRTQLVDRLGELDNIYKNDEFLQNDRFFDDIKSQVGIWKDRFKQEAFQSQIEDIKSHLKTMLVGFNNEVFEYVKNLCKLEFKFPDSVKLLVEALSIDTKFQMNSRTRFKNTVENYLDVYPKNNLTYFKTKPNINPDVLSMKTHFRMDSNSKGLTINTDTLVKRMPIDSEEWNKIQIIRLELKEAQIDDKDLSILSYIWRRMNTPPNLQFKVHPNSVSSNYKMISDILLEGSSSFTSIMIDISGYQIANNEMINLLVTKLLSKMDVLKEVRLVMNDINLLKRTTTLFPRDMVLNAVNLQYFNLRLSKANITDEDIIPIFVPMPNVKRYLLDLENTQVTDRSVSLYVQNTLPHLKSLEIYLMNLNHTNVTDASLKSLFASPMIVKQFQFFIAGTQATDQTVTALTQSIAGTLENLEIFSVNFSHCKMSDQVISNMFKNMPKVKTFTLGLSNTQVLDRTLLIMVKNSLFGMRAMENFAISLDQTGVTDIGVDHVIMNLNTNLKQLVISLQSTAVTDKGVKPFVKDKLRMMMKGLKGFKMNVTDTAVSNELKADIESFEKEVKERAT